MVDWLLVRLKQTDLRSAIYRHGKTVLERKQLTFDGLYHCYPEFPVFFDSLRITNVRKKLTTVKMLTQFGKTPIAKHYFHMIRDYRHIRKSGHQLASVFHCPDSVPAVDAQSKRREPNAIKAAVLHAETYDDDDTHGARFVWRADDGAIPGWVKLDPPVLVLETLSSYFRRIICKLMD